MLDIDAWVLREEARKARAFSWKSFVRNILIVLTACYGVAAALFWIFQSQLLFHPQMQPSWTEKDPDLKELSWDQMGPAGRIQAWRIPGSKPCVDLYFGGNAEETSYRALAWATEFPGDSLQACTGIVWNYPGYGQSEGVPTVESVTQASAVMLTAVRRVWPKARIRLIGRSLGTGLASLWAGDADVHSVVLITPYDGIRSVAQEIFAPIFPFPQALIHQEFNNVKALKGVVKPILIVSVVGDEVLPSPNTQNLVDSLRAGGLDASWLEVVPLEGTSHDAIMEDPRTAYTLRQWRQKTLWTPNL
jgi:hypothetical protein